MHAAGMTLALAVGCLVALIDPSFLLWLAPMLLSLILAPVLSVLTSRVRLGCWLKARNLLLIPEEMRPVPILRQVERLMSTAEFESGKRKGKGAPGFISAVVDPLVNSLHISLLGGKRSIGSALARKRDRLRRNALQNGPDALSAAEKTHLLSDPDCLAIMHRGVWRITNPKAAQAWGLFDDF